MDWDDRVKLDNASFFSRIRKYDEVARDTASVDGRLVRFNQDLVPFTRILEGGFTPRELASVAR